MGNFTIFRCSKILGEAGKQIILQQIFRKFWISNRLSNRYFSENCRWVPLILALVSRVGTGLKCFGAIPIQSHILLNFSTAFYETLTSKYMY